MRSSIMSIPMQKPVYLDAMASTKLDPRIKTAMDEVLNTPHANPHAQHVLGRAMHQYIEQSTNLIKDTLKLSDQHALYYTSGATESNQMVLLGLCDFYQRHGKHIMVLNIEHPSVRACTAYLAKNGYDVTEIKVDHNGIIDLTHLQSSIRKDSILFTCAAVNHEIGVKQPTEQISKILKEHGILYHMDATQSLGKEDITPYLEIADSITISAHKSYGPMGIACMITHKHLSPLILGGSQQRACAQAPCLHT